MANEEWHSVNNFAMDFDDWSITANLKSTVTIINCKNFRVVRTVSNTVAEYVPQSWEV